MVVGNFQGPFSQQVYPGMGVIGMGWMGVIGMHSVILYSNSCITDA